MMTAKAKRAVLLVLAGGIALGLWTHTDQYHCLRARLGYRMIRTSRGELPGTRLDGIYFAVWRVLGRKTSDWDVGDDEMTVWETHFNALVASGYLRKYSLARTNPAVTLREFWKRAWAEEVGRDGLLSLRIDPGGSNVFVTCRPDSFPRWKKLVEDEQANR
jgi:hypothetical protein